MKLRAHIAGWPGLRRSLTEIAAPGASAASLRAAAEDVRAAAALAAGGAEPDGLQTEFAASLRIEAAPDGASVTLSSPLPAAWHLEFGTLRRPPAPWLEPALDAARPKIIARFRGKPRF